MKYLTLTALILVQINSSFAGPLLTGMYATKRVTQNCVIQTTIKKDEIAICSSTLISSSQVLTAGHCLVDPGNTVITCSCGESDRQKSVEYSVQVAGEVHPDYDESKQPNIKVDAQLVTFGTKTRSDCTGAEVAPMPRIKSPDLVKKALSSGRCYLAGWGLDNGRSSALHSVSTPRGHQIDSYKLSNSSVDVVTFYNNAYRSRFSAEQDRLLDKAGQAGANAVAINKLRQEQLKDYDRVMSFMTGDPNRMNSIRQGDSGGTLFCTDENGVDQLLGIIHSEWQEVVLTSSPLINEWLEKLVK